MDPGFAVDLVHQLGAWLCASCSHTASPCRSTDFQSLLGSCMPKKGQGVNSNSGRTLDRVTMTLSLYSSTTSCTLTPTRLGSACRPSGSCTSHPAWRLEPSSALPCRPTCAQRSVLCNLACCPPPLLQTPETRNKNSVQYCYNCSATRSTSRCLHAL